MISNFRKFLRKYLWRRCFWVRFQVVCIILHTYSPWAQVFSHGKKEQALFHKKTLTIYNSGKIVPSFKFFNGNWCAYVSTKNIFRFYPYRNITKYYQWVNISWLANFFGNTSISRFKFVNILLWLFVRNIFIKLKIRAKSNKKKT